MSRRRGGSDSPELIARVVVEPSEFAKEYSCRAQSSQGLRALAHQCVRKVFQVAVSSVLSLTLLYIWPSCAGFGLRRLST